MSAELLAQLLATSKPVVAAAPAAHRRHGLTSTIVNGAASLLVGWKVAEDEMIAGLRPSTRRHLRPQVDGGAADSSPARWTTPPRADRRLRRGRYFGNTSTARFVTARRTGEAPRRRPPGQRTSPYRRRTPPGAGRLRAGRRLDRCSTTSPSPATTTTRPPHRRGCSRRHEHGPLIDEPGRRCRRGHRRRSQLLQRRHRRRAGPRLKATDRHGIRDSSMPTLRGLVVDGQELFVRSSAANVVSTRSGGEMASGRRYGSRGDVPPRPAADVGWRC